METILTIIATIIIIAYFYWELKYNTTKQTPTFKEWMGEDFKEFSKN